MCLISWHRVETVKLVFVKGVSSLYSHLRFSWAGYRDAGKVGGVSSGGEGLEVTFQFPDNDVLLALSELSEIGMDFAAV